MTEHSDIAMIPAWVDGVLQPVEKLAAHQKALRHKAVSVFVVRDGKLLLQQRALGKYHTPGLWANTCCTHPYWDEAPLDCALRRLDEEIGITGLALKACGQIEYHADVGGGLTEHEVVDVYFARATADMQITLNPNEVMAFEWISVDELASEIASGSARFVPWLKIYIEQHHAQIFGV